ncbi:MAG TPA: ankyrin repeat domain-containing protein [Kofleriaceae bacterium]|nr:ankyrin repeat domain-containing protein [Kofleriaceae bacterium]
MSWWSKLFGAKRAQPSPDARASSAKPTPSGPTASWIPADRNPFGVPVLDLISITGNVISTSRSKDEAAMAVSWSGKLVADLALACRADRSLPCALRYPADPTLGDGWLYVPPAMEHKWAIAYRDGAIHMIRSWTGEVLAIGRARRDGAELVVERIEVVGTALEVFGGPIATFDWMLRAHALDQRVPLPVDRDGAAMLERAPMSVFNVFGPVAACAAESWAPPPPTRALRAASDVVTAVRLGQDAQVRALVAGGAVLDTPSPVLGLTALHVAVIQGNVEMVDTLLALGANANALGDRHDSPLLTAVVHAAPLAILDRLASHGGDPAVTNADEFGMLHAIAETDRPAYLAWALAHGLALEARTRHGHTPLHIAAALGHIAALNALLAAGADRAARDPEGKTARDIALAENKPAAIAALDAAS